MNLRFEHSTTQRQVNQSTNRSKDCVVKRLIDSELWNVLKVRSRRPGATGGYTINLNSSFKA